jgi:hypothetical protein
MPGEPGKGCPHCDKMNINSGGKNVPHMHNTVILLTNPFGKGGQIQKMQFDDILPDNDLNKQYQG